MRRSIAVVEPLWTYASEPPWDLAIGQQVWDLHLALIAAAERGETEYSVTAEDAANIRMDAGHREEVLALTSILAAATPDLTPELRERAVRVADAVLAKPKGAETFVQLWLEWRPDSGPPPYDT